MSEPASATCRSMNVIASPPRRDSARETRKKTRPIAELGWRRATKQLGAR